MKKVKKSKILVIRSGAVGDVIMTTPFIKNLRENFPDSEIEFLVGKWSSGVLKDNPHIDEIIEFDDEIVVKKRIFGVSVLIRQLREKKFDLCFILDKSWMWNLFAFLCGIKERIGFSRGGEGIWNTKSVTFEGLKNEVKYNLDLLELKGLKTKDYATEIFTSKGDNGIAQKFMGSVLKSEEKKVIGLCPGGASNPGQDAFIKRWSVLKYIELTNKLDCTFLVFGDMKDGKIAEEIISKSENKGIYDATGKSIQETKEIMEKCKIIVGHDSGGMQIASTTSSKLIALFGPTPSNRFAPRNAEVIIADCVPCYTIYGKFDKCEKDCMDSIKVESIIDKIG